MEGQNPGRGGKKGRVAHGSPRRFLVTPAGVLCFLASIPRAKARGYFLCAPAGAAGRLATEAKANHDRERKRVPRAAPAEDGGTNAGVLRLRTCLAALRMTEVFTDLMREQRHWMEEKGEAVARRELSIPVPDAITGRSGTATESRPYLVYDRHLRCLPGKIICAHGAL